MEAQERILLEDVFGLTLTDVCGGALEKMSPSDKQKLATLKARLQKGEPVQYVTGKAPFCGRFFHVEPGVLIPRPETEELVDIVISMVNGQCSTVNGSHPLNILDIGTGSGCIAISLALQENTNVTAWDISEKALAIARKNAEHLKASVSFECQDIFKVSKVSVPVWDIIISNPPYICHKEAPDMEANVLDHEPHEALFVPDEKPLLFYEAIGKYAQQGLKLNGLLAFEINPLYANLLYDSLSHQGFHDISIINDSFGKQRFILCYR